MTIEHTKLIAVEGKNEIEFFKNYLKYLKINTIQLLNIEGKDNFGKKLKDLTLVSNFEIIEKILLIRDADYSVSSNSNEDAFKSLSNSLKLAKLPSPKDIATFTDKSLDGIPQTAIYIMPYAKVEGMFEDLLLKSISENELDCIESFFNCINKKIAIHKLPKAKVQVYLAAQPEPKSDINGSFNDSQTINGIETGYWDFNHSCFNELKELLLSM